MDAAATSPSTSPPSTLIDSQLYTAGCPPVDILIRTSGEQRLSDFLLRQSSHALLVFTGVLWPEFGFLDLIGAILKYQRSFTTLEMAKQQSTTSVSVSGAILCTNNGASGAAIIAERQKNDDDGDDDVQHIDVPPMLQPPAMGVLKMLKVPRPSAAAAAESPCSVATPGSIHSSSPSSPVSSSSSLTNSTTSSISTTGSRLQGDEREHDADDAPLAQLLPDRKSTGIVDCRKRGSTASVAAHR